MTKPILDAVLVAAGKYHDVDFARLELLKLLAEHPNVRVRVCADYADTAAIAKAKFLVTYCCDVRPSEAQQDALASFVQNGGRWIALHGKYGELGAVRQARALAVPGTGFPRFPRTAQPGRDHDRGVAAVPGPLPEFRVLRLGRSGSVSAPVVDLDRPLPGGPLPAGSTRQSVIEVRGAGLSQAVKRATITRANSTNWGWNACCR